MTGRTRALLENVGQLVREQPAAGAGGWSILVAGEYDIMTDGIRPGLNVSGRLGGTRVTVNSHVAEVGAEARLHERPGLSVERFA
jgi:hypothetical protein